MFKCCKSRYRCRICPIVAARYVDRRATDPFGNERSCVVSRGSTDADCRRDTCCREICRDLS